MQGTCKVALGGIEILSIGNVSKKRIYPYF